MGLDKETVKTKTTAIESVLEVGATQGAEIIKESLTSAIGELLVDTGASMIPGLGGALASYKRARLERNVEAFAEELSKQIDTLQQLFEQKTLEQRADLDRLLELVLDYVVDEPQQEKIQYLINGFMNIVGHDSIKEDFVLVYYDLLTELRMVDLTVIKLYGRYYMEQIENPVNSYQDVLSMHDISYEQYEIIRKNLLRKGILTTKKDLIFEKDLESIEKSIQEIYKYLGKLGDSKTQRLPRLKDLKLKSKDTLEITKFGREFIQFFLLQSEDNT